MSAALVCAEYYGDSAFADLLGAVDVPADEARRHAIKIGRLICRVHGREYVNAALVDQYGNTIEKLIVVK